ncbi:protein asteroid homolog 1 [Melanotaenia boesemani]|uniref:protein asteroid homolog 1 n=1 Tax=Melanotaenia boesemani TaxID=1250792 RepID=UPI001C0421E2|nr:protein asteroid homolog 1 [Melanotaenia boesemani]
MGVQGLASFMETHGRIYLDVQFRKSRLVIDGSNLVHQLYFSSGLDQNHGGEYAAFEELTESFITALRTCGIAPYVVLDGGSDSSDKKLETVTKRAQDRIQRAHRAAVSGSQEGILPLLARRVFKQTLARLEVPVAQCFMEADQEIAALASEWQCPVLSNDSDFYIFDLPAGFLPISHFRWRDVNRAGSQSYIPCKRYYSSSFCVFFGIQQRLLPTFAALAGNDYVKLGGISWTQFVPVDIKAPNRLDGLLRWIKKFQLREEAVEAALQLIGPLGKTSQKKILQKLLLGEEEYHLHPSCLKRFFIHGAAPPFPAAQEGLVPDWTLLPLTQACLSGNILDVLQLQRMNLRTAVEHEDLLSFNLTSRPVRQVMYGLLLGGGTSLQVQERDREGLQVKFIHVRPSFTRLTRRLKISSLYEVEVAERLQVLLEALGVKEDSLSLLPPELKLPVAVTCYWMQRAQPPPDLKLLKALLLGMSTGDLPRPTTENQPCSQKPDVGVTHAINQWQGCLGDSIHLNQLLSFPLPEPDVARLYQGTLVHQLVHRMGADQKPKAFLKSNRTNPKQYNTMLSIVRQFLAHKAPPVVSEKQQRALQPSDDLSANLQQLFLLHHDNEMEMEVRSALRAQEEQQLEEQLMLRTRYRTKERSNRCKNPQLARKEESRGWGLL